LSSCFRMKVLRSRSTCVLDPRYCTQKTMLTNMKNV